MSTNFDNERCTRCNQKDTIITDYESGELVYNNCGLVYEERMIVDEYEKRTFENDDGDHQIQRVGPPMKPEYGNECGVDLIIREKGKTKIIKSYSKFTKIQRNFCNIQNILSQKQIPKNMIEETKSLYSKFAENKNMQGRKIKNIIIAIFYYVCRKEKTPKTIKEISDMFGLTEREIKKAFNSIKSEIVEPIKDENEINDIGKNFIQSFIGGDIARYELKLLAFKILDNLNQTAILEGKSPKTIAGLSLFLSCKLLNDNLIDKEDFYTKFSNKNTLSKAYNQIKNDIKMIIPQEYADKINF
jgi:transcription initiation factor TFIIB